MTKMEPMMIVMIKVKMKMMQMMLSIVLGPNTQPVV